VLSGGIALNLIAFLIVFPVNLCHPFAIPPGIAVRLAIGFLLGFVLLPIKPPHGFVILGIKMTKTFLIAVSIISTAIIVIWIGPSIRFIPPITQSIRIKRGRDTVRARTVRARRGSAVRIVREVAGRIVGSAEN
jgi:hypothetical protein